MRETVPSSVLATQTAPAPNATAVGPPPTPIVCVTTFVAGSTRTSRFSAPSLIQTDPAPTAIPRPSAPMSNVLTAPLAGSMRETDASSTFVTHTDPKPKATAVGEFPTRIGSPATSFASGSIRETVPSRLFATQTLSSP